MLERIKSRALRSLPEWLGLTAGETVGHIDLAPLQPVFDASRMLERGGIGYFTTGVGVNAVGAGTTRGQLGRDAVQALFLGTSNPISMWFIDAWAYSDGTAFTFADLGLSLEFEGSILAFQPASKVVRQWSGYSSAGETVAGEGNPLYNAYIGSPNMSYAPTFLPPGPNVTFDLSAVSTGADTITVGLLLWAGPEGSSPPGMG